jgi:NTE family protein
MEQLPREIPDGVSLVLGGGGGRGLAHIGVWRALQELEVRPARIVASSIGALIGACVAAGMSWQELAVRAQRLGSRSVFAFNGWILSQGTRSRSLLREEPLRALIRSLVPVARFDELPIPLTINAIDLATGRVAWFGEGGRTDLSLADAIYASCAIPLFFPPAAIGGDFYVDGAIVDPLPIARARLLGAKRIVAVDLAAPAEAPHPCSGMVETYCRVVEILQERCGQAPIAGPAPDVVHVRPTLSGDDTFDLSRGEALIEAGYHATFLALAGQDPEPVAAAAAPRRAEESRWLPSWLFNVPATFGRMSLSR